MALKTYTSDDIDVHFDLKRCIHAGKCVKGAPEVFDIKAKPWVNPAKGSDDAIAGVVRSCPSGALTWTRKDGAADEAAPTTNQVRIVADGQLEFTGTFEWNGETLHRATLCRCGESANKPFCDNAHKGAGFSDDGLPDAGDVGDAGASGAVVCDAFTNGPLKLTGNLEVLAADGEVIFRGEEAYLCRCGRSDNKPFCDGAHKRSGWTE